MRPIFHLARPCIVTCQQWSVGTGHRGPSQTTSTAQAWASAEGPGSDHGEATDPYEMSSKPHLPSSQHDRPDDGDLCCLLRCHW